MQPEARIAIIGMASMLTGRKFDNSPAGFEMAIGLLTAQHEKVQPPAIRTRLYKAVSNNDPIIDFSEQMFALALHENDFFTALSASNHLFAYAEIDYNDSLGNHALALALRSHRDFAKIILEQFSNRDPYLKMFGSVVFDDAKKLGEEGDTWKEIILLRGLIHLIAINGTLGIETKEHVDPFALFHKEK